MTTMAAAVDILGEEEAENVPEGHFVMAIMDKTGDTKVTWDPRNEDEVANARRTFADLRKKHFLAFRVNAKDGSKGEQTTEFDPNQAMYIMVPAYVGG
jgi:hypothetical protein